MDQPGEAGRILSNSFRTGLKELLAMIGTAMGARRKADDMHARRSRRDHTEGAVLYHDALFGKDSQSSGGEQEQVRCWFAMAHLIGAKDAVTE